MQQIAEAVRRSGGTAVVARVVGLKGFSTLPVDELVLVDRDGRQQGDLLGRPGAEKLGAAASEMLSAAVEAHRVLEISIHGKEVGELGLACGGQAEVLMQPVSTIPAELWRLLEGRAPAALITSLSGGGAPTVVDRTGHSWGPLTQWADQAMELLAAGRSGTRRVEAEEGEVLIEAWVPDPRLVVVGSGDVVDSLRAQADLLGWELQACDSASEVGELLDWAGETAALIVLSHDPHVDVPALATGLERGVPYVGAMGSRSTQSRRIGRLQESGVSPAELERIHRPIGLNLGGRRAPEVALAIVAEILAEHYDRDARSLRETSGPIH